MRHQLKPKTPSARARMHYILRSDRYGVKVAELAAAGVANLPSWADGPAAFWSAVDGFERKNARLCLELELNLPREISRDGQAAAVADYIDRLTAEAGKFPITWAIHDSGDGNPHVHLMLQERPLDGVDRDGPKAHFKRADKKRPERAGVEKSRWWHSKERVFWSRALWADACNQQLLAEGHIARFDPRRKSQRLDEALRADNLRAAAVLCTRTERHEGVKVAAARKKLEGGWIEAADLPEQVMQIISGNDSARHYNNWLRDWSRTATDKELRLFLADHLHDLHKTLAGEMQGTHIAAWLEQQHIEALDEDAERDAELAELIQVEQSAQVADLGLLGAVQAAHIEALDEDAVRTRLHGILAHHMAKALGEGALDRTAGQEVLDNLGPGVPDLQDAIERVKSLRVEFMHAEALAEDAGRGRYAAQLLNLVSSGTAAGWLSEDEGDDLLYALIGPHTLEWLKEEVAALVAADAEHAYRQWVAVQAAHAEALAEDAQPISHDDDADPQWLVVENRDGEVIGHWSDDPDAEWRYDHDADDWVEHDPDHRPSSGPRMG